MSSHNTSSPEHHRGVVSLLRRYFVLADDAYGTPGPDGLPDAIREPLTEEVLMRHVAGKARIGAYNVDRHDMATALCLDVDEDNPTLARSIADELERLGFHSLIETSKSRGFHIWALTVPVPAGILRGIGLYVAACVGAPDLEVYPKQAERGGVDPETGKPKLGNFVWLPLFGSDVPKGRTVFLDRGNGLSPFSDQIDFLSSVPQASLETVAAAQAIAESTSGPFRARKKEPVPDAIPLGKRRDTLTRIAGANRRLGLGEAEIIPILMKVNETRCDPPVPDKDVRAIARSIMRYTPEAPVVGTSGPMSQVEDHGQVVPDDGTGLQECDASGEGGAGRVSKANRLLALLGRAQLFHSPDGTPFIIPRRDALNAPYPIRSQAFKDLAARIFHLAEQSTIGTSDLSAVIGALCGKAIFDSPCIEVFLRVAQVDKTITIDLGSNKRTAVVVTPNGWTVTSSPSVMFRRTPGMLPLPTPEHGGKIADLRKFVNVGTEGDAAADTRFVLVVCWILGALRGRGPYGVLVVCGEQGSGKSQLIRRLRHLIDPNSCPLHAVPATQRDLVILASNAHVMALDNLSFLPSDRSDDFCRIADGGGVATRTLYTDMELTVFGEARPIAINSIEDVAVRGDLLDRAVAIRLPSIAPENRKTEDEMNAEFALAAPKILGALFDGISAGLRNIDSVRADGLPRQADLLRWLRACESGMGWPEGTVDKAFASTKAEANRLVVESNSVARAVWQLVSARGEWSGHAHDLLNELNGIVSEKAQESKNWPKAANTLSNKLRRVAPSLRALGMVVDLEGRDPKENRPLIVLSMSQRDGDLPSPQTPAPTMAGTSIPKSEQMSLTPTQKSGDDGWGDI